MVLSMLCNVFYMLSTQLTLNTFDVSTQPLSALFLCQQHPQFKVRHQKKLAALFITLITFETGAFQMLVSKNSK